MSRTFKRDPRVEGAPLNDEAILLDPSSSRFFMLNHTGAFIWDHLDPPASAEALANEICKAYDNVSLEDALKDVNATLAEMLTLELVVANAS